MASTLSANEPLALVTPRGLVVRGIPAYRLHFTRVPKEDDGLFTFRFPDTDCMYEMSKGDVVGDGSWLSTNLRSTAMPTLSLQRPLGASSFIKGIIVGQYGVVDDATRKGMFGVNWNAEVLVREANGYVRRAAVPGSRVVGGIGKAYKRARYQEALDPETGVLRDAWAEVVSLDETWRIS